MGQKLGLPRRLSSRTHDKHMREEYEKAVLSRQIDYCWNEFCNYLKTGYNSKEGLDLSILNKIRSKYSVLTLNEYLSGELNPILVAALEMDFPYEFIAYLLDCGCHVNQPSMIQTGFSMVGLKPSHTPLSMALQRASDSRTILMLVRCGANLRIRDPYKRPAISRMFSNHQVRLDAKLFDTILYYSFYEAMVPFDCTPLLNPTSGYLPPELFAGDIPLRIYDDNSASERETPVALFQSNDIHGSPALVHCLRHPYATVDIVRSMVLSGALKPDIDPLYVAIHTKGIPDVVEYIVSSGFTCKDPQKDQLRPYFEYLIIMGLYSGLSLPLNTQYPSLLAALHAHHNYRIRAYFDATFYTYPQVYFLTYGVFPWFKHLVPYQATWVELYEQDLRLLKQCHYRGYSATMSDSLYGYHVNTRDVEVVYQYHHHYHHNDIAYDGPAVVYSPLFLNHVNTSEGSDGSDDVDAACRDALLTYHLDFHPMEGAFPLHDEQHPRPATTHIASHHDTTSNTNGHFHVHGDDLLARYEHLLLSTPTIYKRLAKHYGQTSLSYPNISETAELAKDFTWYKFIQQHAADMAVSYQTSIAPLLFSDTIPRRLGYTTLHRDKTPSHDLANCHIPDTHLRYLHAPMCQEPVAYTTPVSLHAPTRSSPRRPLPLQHPYSQLLITMFQHAISYPYLFSPLPQQSTINSLLLSLNLVDPRYVLTPCRKAVTLDYDGTLRFDIISPNHFAIPAYTLTSRHGEVRSGVHRFPFIPRTTENLPYTIPMSVYERTEARLLGLLGMSPDPNNTDFVMTPFPVLTSTIPMTIQEYYEVFRRMPYVHEVPKTLVPSYLPTTSTGAQRSTSERDTEHHEGALDDSNPSEEQDTSPTPDAAPHQGGLPANPMPVHEHLVDEPQPRFSLDSPSTPTQTTTAQHTHAEPTVAEPSPPLEPTPGENPLPDSQERPQQPQTTPSHGSLSNRRTAFGAATPDLRFLDTICTTQDNTSRGLFWYALETCQPSIDDIYTLFVGGCDPGYLNADLQTPLMGAMVRHWPVQSLLWFTNAMSDTQLRTKDKFGRTILHYTFLTGAYRSMDGLWLQWVTQLGLDPEEQDKHGHTPLSLALITKAGPDIIKQLIGVFDTPRSPYSSPYPSTPFSSLTREYTINYVKYTRCVDHPDDPVRPNTPNFRSTRPFLLTPLQLAETMYFGTKNDVIIHKIIKKAIKANAT